MLPRELLKKIYLQSSNYWKNTNLSPMKPESLVDDYSPARVSRTRIKITFFWLSSRLNLFIQAMILWVFTQFKEPDQYQSCASAPSESYQTSCSVW